MVPARVLGDRVVPACPRARVARQHSFVGVQRRDVALIADRAEDLALGGRRVGKHAQRLIAVRRHDHTVEEFRAAAGEHFDELRAPDAVVRDDLVHGHVEMYAMRERRGEGLDVASGTTGHGAPFGPPRELEQPVVVHEPRVRAHREAHEGRRIGRPDRRAEGDQELPHE